MKKSLIILALIFLVLSTVSAAPLQYHQFGRNPCVPGGLTADQFMPGENFYILKADQVGRMRGASGEVTPWGIFPAGTQVTIVKQSETESEEVWRAARVVCCGNPITTEITIRRPKPRPPAQAPPQQMVIVMAQEQRQQELAFPRKRSFGGVNSYDTKASMDLIASVTFTQVPKMVNQNVNVNKGGYAYQTQGMGSQNQSQTNGSNINQPNQPVNIDNTDTNEYNPHNTQSNNQANTQNNTQTNNNAQSQQQNQAQSSTNTNNVVPGP